MANLKTENLMNHQGIPSSFENSFESNLNVSLTQNVCLRYAPMAFGEMVSKLWFESRYLWQIVTNFVLNWASQNDVSMFIESHEPPGEPE